MTPTRLRQIARQLYRPARPSDYAFQALLAADLGKSVAAVKSWLMDPTAAGHRSMPAEIDWVLERAARHADALHLWDRPAGAVTGLLFQRLDALLMTSGGAGEKAPPPE